MSKAVIVTTEYRGVFFGYAENTSGDTIFFKNMRNCIYWDASIGGFAGLASVGPNSKCRIGAACDGELRKITSVLTVTETAEKAWLDCKTYKG